MSLRVAFIHPDLGLGGAERLVVDSALGLQRLGHTVHIYTSHHDPDHCFEETKTELNVIQVEPPRWLPTSVAGRFHIIFAHARQLQLTFWLIWQLVLLPWISVQKPLEPYDVFFVDQLSTCIPFLRLFTRTRVLFYCHFPDKLLSEGQFAVSKKKGGLLKRLYRLPMDWLEEATTRQADVILANSNFTRSIFEQHFASIKTVPRVVHPGINIAAYETAEVDTDDKGVKAISSDRPMLVSLNRFERKKNAVLALRAFAALNSFSFRLVLAGGYESRIEDNVQTLKELVQTCRDKKLTYRIVASIPIPEHLQPPDSDLDASVLFILNYTNSQRTYLLRSPQTVALLYTPQNEHFGIGPVEAMICGVPVIAWGSGGPVESVLDDREGEERRTGWLVPSDAGEDAWIEVLRDKVLALDSSQRQALGQRAIERAKKMFGMEAMCSSLQAVLIEAVDMGKIPIPYGWLVQILLGLTFCGFLVYLKST